MHIKKKQDSYTLRAGAAIQPADLTRCNKRIKCYKIIFWQRSSVPSNYFMTGFDRRQTWPHNARVVTSPSATSDQSAVGVPATINVLRGTARRAATSAAFWVRVLHYLLGLHSVLRGSAVPSREIPWRPGSPGARAPREGLRGADGVCTGGPWVPWVPCGP